MSGYYQIVCHVNMHCSGTTYSHFCLKHLAKKALKKANYPEIPPKNKQKILPWKLRNPKTCLKWRTWGVKNRNVKKNKRALGSGRFYSQTKSNLLETFVSNRYSIFFSIKTAKKPSEHGWLFLHSMSLKHALLRYNTFPLLHQTLIKKRI